MVKNFLFKDRDGQTPLPPELYKGLRPKHIQTMGELDEYEEQNIAEGLAWLKNYQSNGRFGRILIEYFCNQHDAQIPSWGISLKNSPKARRQTYIEALDRVRRDLDYQFLLKFMFS